jgi:hypothetical protein
MHFGDHLAAFRQCLCSRYTLLHRHSPPFSTPNSARAGSENIDWPAALTASVPSKLHPPSAIFTMCPASLHVMPCQPQQDVVGVAVLQPVAQPSLQDAIQPSPFEVEWYVSQRRAHSLECPGSGGVGAGGEGVGFEGVGFEGVGFEGVGGEGIGGEGVGGEGVGGEGVGDEG